MFTSAKAKSRPPLARPVSEGQQIVRIHPEHDGPRQSPTLRTWSMFGAAAVGYGRDQYRI